MYVYYIIHIKSYISPYYRKFIINLAETFFFGEKNLAVLQQPLHSTWVLNFAFNLSKKVYLACYIHFAIKRFNTCLNKVSVDKNSIHDILSFVHDNHVLKENQVFFHSSALNFPKPFGM